VLAFPVCSPGHHYSVFMRRGPDNVVEVVALDSNWSGHSSLQQYALPSPDINADQHEVLRQLGDVGADMVVLDGYMQFVCALLAQIYWPEKLYAPRPVVQRFPLTPHQGPTLDCGVYTCYYLAALHAHPEAFLEAFSPARRLVVTANFGSEFRGVMVQAALAAVNAYDMGLDEFLQQVGQLHDAVRPYSDVQNDQELVQQNQASPDRVLRAANDLVRPGRFPSLLEMARSLA
jgi:hypothetical protein